MAHNNSTGNIGTQEKPNLVDFTLHYNGLISKYSEILQIKFEKKIISKNPISFWFQDYWYTYHNGTYNDLIWKKQRLEALLIQLNEIQNYDSNLIKKFQKKIKNIGKDEFYGERLEIHISNQFIRKSIIFQKTERPDFEIKWNNDTVFLECTSSHFESIQTQEVYDKIISSIQSKRGKPYCNDKTALFVDITNLYFHDTEQNTLFDKSQLQSLIGNEFKMTPFGAVLLVGFFTDQTGYGAHYDRFDNEKMNESLKGFLDKYYGFSSFTISNHIVPKQG